MKVKIILAGLKKDTAEAVLQRMEALTGQLPNDTEFCLYQKDCEDAESEIKSWAAGLKTVSHENDDTAEFTLFAGTAKGKELAMRYAAAAGLPCYTEIVSFNETSEGELHAVRKVYSTHLDGHFPVQGAVLAVSPIGEKKEYEKPQADCSADTAVYDFELLAANLINMDSAEKQLIHTEKTEKKEDLSGARLVLLGGKGLGKKENFQRLEVLAKKLGAACGCTRPVAMAGWAGYDKVVGISGSILQADVCIAFGVSGAGPLMTGAGGAARLVAVNNDPKAPIFSQCSDGLAADCLEILTAMEQLAEQEI